MIGYDTYGPQYPPEWDEIDIVVCSVCGESGDASFTEKIDGEIICNYCQED